ncbi:TNFSF5 protein [Danaus plexippus plexippus]|uniref:TNFSF5 protein n=1 Tax=Danaus plexippus plexippus TaxID=278856 RepID=A0A212EVG7_DANPL|nr:TNFSF5 protein [Danaus plexippus plexippus]
MDGERKVNLSEGVPLNSSGGANIFLNAGKNNKLNDGTVIHLTTEKPTDVGVHINTTFSIASSKKIKLLFILNFLLSVICMIISCSIAFYYWNEMTSMRRQLDVLRDQFLIQNLKDGLINNEKPLQSPLVSQLRPAAKRLEHREGRSGIDKNDISPNARRYFVEDLGEDMLFMDSSKKSPSQSVAQIQDLPVFHKEPLIVQFNGAMPEINLGTQSLIGPWVRDLEVSTKDSESKIELVNNYFAVKESGLYIIYAQVVYLTHAPNCYFIWARQPALKPRLITTCATGDDASARPLDKSQISCSVQTVARLYKGDTVNMAQREHNRTLWLIPGYTYFGFVKISS